MNAIKHIKQQRILDCCTTQPKSIKQIAATIGASVSFVRRQLTAMRAEKRAHIVYYVEERGNHQAFYLAGKGVEATPPACLKQRADRMRDAIMERPLKPEKGARNVQFDYTRPVRCYGIWGMA